MKSNELINLQGQVVRTRPVTRNLNIHQGCQHRDYAWRVGGISDGGLVLGDFDIPYHIVVPFAYVEECLPEARNFLDGNNHSILALRCEIVISGDRVSLEPLRA